MEKTFQQVSENDVALKFLYETRAGRCLLKLLTLPFLSKIAGAFLDSRASRFLIGPFMRGNHINPSEYEYCDYQNFNECFTRKIKPALRPIDSNPDHFISPCDGLLSVYPIIDGLVVPVKQSHYTIESLLKSKKLAKKFDGGICLVFRLCVNHYHRYCYLDRGRKSKNYLVPGRLHTVQPIALRNVPVFTENCREYSLLDTENFGQVLQCEVGAMLVGKIKNHDQEAEIERGQEKGMFLYGGSTIIVLLEKDKVKFPGWFYETADDKLEIPVQMGQCLGLKLL